MTPPTYLLVAGGSAALLALLLSVTPLTTLAYRLATLGLWLALLVIPAAIGLDLAELSTVDAATVFQHALEHIRNYAAIALPCVFLASLAQKRARAARSRSS